VESQNPHTAWNALVYIGADDDLRREGSECLQYLSALEPDDSVHLAVQIDRAENGFLDVLGRQGGARRYIFSQSCQMNTLQRFALEVFGWNTSACKAAQVDHLGHTDSASAECLTSFLAWGMKEPDDRYNLVVLFGHGDGFLGLLEDDSANTRMSVPQLAESLSALRSKKARPLDVLFLHACWMCQIEVLYQLRDEAQYIVASQQHLKEFGFPIEAAVQSLHATPRQPAEFSSALLHGESFQADGVPSLSRVDMAQFSSLMASFEQFCESLLDCPEPVFSRHAQRARKANRIVLREPPYEDFVDLFFFIESLVEDDDLKSPKLKTQGAKLLEAIQVCIDERHLSQYEEHNGLSIYLPSGPVTPAYRELAFTKDTPWLKVISQFQNGGRS
jgi:hypothetical protein